MWRVHAVEVNEVDPDSSFILISGVSCTTVDLGDYDEIHTRREIRVVDGDTFVLKSKDEKLRVRLARVDASETTQVFGRFIVD